MRTVVLTALVLILLTVAAFGQWAPPEPAQSSNPFSEYNPNNPFGVYGNPFSEYSNKNPFGAYGNPFSDVSPKNPFSDGPVPVPPGPPPQSTLPRPMYEPPEAYR